METSVPKLTIRDPEGRQRDVLLGDRDLRIGRDKQNDIVLEDMTKAVSRSHAVLRYESGQYVLVDMNSQNGLWVGGERVPSIALQPGVSVLVGAYTIVFDGPPPAAAETVIAGAEPTIVRRVGVGLGDEPASEAPPRPEPVKAGASPSRRIPAPTRKAGLIATPTAALAAGGVALALIVVIATFVAVRRRHVFREPSPPLPTVPVSPPPVPASPTVDDQVREHVALAKTHLAAQEIEEATAELDRALDLDPVNDEALGLKTTLAEKQRLAAVKPLDKPSVPPKGGPARGTPSPAGTAPPIPQRPGESAEAWNARWNSLQERYERARTALAGNSIQQAITILTTLQGEEPAYRDAAILLGEARNRQRDAAQGVVESAGKLETAGDLRAALVQYRQAQQMGANDVANIDRVLARMKAEGTRMFNEADPYFTLNRTREAIERYERAYDLLPDDDPNRKIAKERLDKLRGRP